MDAWDDGDNDFATVWDIHSGCCAVRITDEEAKVLVAKWEEFITGRKPEVAAKGRLE